jgi:O-antigen ligase
MEQIRISSLPSFLLALLICAALWTSFSFHGFSFGEQTIRFAIVLALLSIAVATALLFRRPQRHVNWSPWLICGLAFGLWCTLSLFWNPSQFAGVSDFLKMATLPAIVLVFLYWRNSEELWIWSEGLLLLSAIVLAAWGLFDHYDGTSYTRAAFLNRNVYGGFMNLMALLAVTRYFRIKTGSAWLMLLLLLVLFLAVNASQSRGALLAAGIALALFSLNAWKTGIIRPHGQRLAAVWLAFIVAFGAVNLSLPKAAYSAISATVDQIKEPASLNGRSVIWKHSLDLLKKEPFYGTGLGTYWSRYPEVRHPRDGSAGFNAHNDYLQLVIEGGLPALLLALLTAWLFLRALIRHVNNDRTDTIERNGLAAALCAIAIQAFFTQLLLLIPILMVIGLYAGRLASHHLPRPASASPLLSSRWRSLSNGLTLVFLVLSLFLLGRLSMAAYGYEAALQAYKQGEPTSASRLLSDAAALQPGIDSIYIAHADLLFKAMQKSRDQSSNNTRQHIESLGVLLEQAEKANPYRAEVALMRAKLALLNPDQRLAARESVSALEEALRRDPRHLESRILLAAIHQQLGRTDQAYKTYTEGLPYFYPDSRILVEYNIKTAQAYVVAGETQKGIAIAEQANQVLAKINNNNDTDLVALLKEQFGLR